MQNKEGERRDRLTSVLEYVAKKKKKKTSSDKRKKNSQYFSIFEQAIM